MIQIGFKLEIRTNLARLGMFYGNKTSSKFNQFLVGIKYPGILSTQLLCQVCWSFRIMDALSVYKFIQTKSVDPEIEAGAQVQQLINVACLQQFSQSPILNVTFAYTYDPFIY